jgi:hypothetical protein
MPRYASGWRLTCEGCKSLDIRELHRDHLLRPGRRFSLSWSRNGEPTGGIDVETEPGAVLLLYRTRSGDSSEWRDIQQRISITWTRCALGGHRPWFICSVYSNGRFCGRRVAILYAAGDLFACRHCYGLAYASQSEGARVRSLRQARKIRLRLGGGLSLYAPFPEKPRGMHWQTYRRLRGRAEAAEFRWIASIGAYLEYLDRRSNWRMHT